MSTDLELDDEAKALAEAISATPDDASTGDASESTEKPVKKGASKGVKIMIGGAALLLLAMGGAYVAMEMGVGQPVQKAQPRPSAPPLLDEKPMQAAQPVVETPVSKPAMQAGSSLPPVQNQAPADPFNAPAPAPVPAADDPFKASAPVQTPAPAPVVEAPKPEVAPVTVAKDKKAAAIADKVDSTEAAPAKIQKKKSTVKKHKAVPEDNGYVRII